MLLVQFHLLPGEMCDVIFLFSSLCLPGNSACQTSSSCPDELTRWRAIKDMTIHCSWSLTNGLHPLQLTRDYRFTLFSLLFVIIVKPERLVDEILALCLRELQRCA